MRKKNYNRKSKKSRKKGRARERSTDRVIIVVLFY